MNNQAVSAVEKGSSRFTPTNPCLRGILKLFSDEKSADVIFNVNNGGQQGQIFYAHRLILQANAPDLLEYCENCGCVDDGGEDDKSEAIKSVPIDDVCPDIFGHLLYYVYGGTVSDKVLQIHSRDIIEAADKFAIGGLKVLAEGWYVNTTNITWDNLVDNFYFSDTMKCALLKEKVMDVLVENETEALNRLSKQDDVLQSETMLTDFLTALAKKRRKSDAKVGGAGYEFKTMSIDIMRRKLDSRGMDVDGTRDMLIRSLEKSYGLDAIVVTGAGLECLNGRYACVEEFHGAPLYKMNGSYQSNNVVFAVYRYRAAGCFKWYISIIPDHLGPGTTSDIDLYSCAVVSPEEKPPTNGWIGVPGSDAHEQAAPEVYIEGVVYKN